MAASSWMLWLALSAAFAALSAWHYRRRETPGRGRALLALLRGATLALVLLLLFDPELPARGAPPARGTQVLIDASLSMRMPAAAGAAESRWTRAVALARARAGAAPVMLFGSAPRAVAAAALPAQVPGAARTLLLPALQAAAEAGVRRVIVITDGGIEDYAAVAAWAGRLGVEIVPELVGEPLPNRSLVEASAPAWAQAGRPVAVEVGVLAPPDDSIRVTASAAGRVVARTTLGPPAPGRLAAGTLEFVPPAPPAGGWMRIDLEIEGADPVPDDDRRTVYVHVSEQPAGIALVSLRPDWEPRFLAPVLGQALGLPLQAFLRVAPDRYARLAGGLEAGAMAEEDEVRRAIARAELVVLHGAGDDMPEWASTAVRAARRLIVFPAGDGPTPGLPLTVGAPVPGDWYVTATVPSSPLAPLLADQELAAATPLTALRPTQPPTGAWAALLAARGRQGAPQPIIVAGETAGRRWAVVAASGFWQWSFRGGEERALYTRLWAAVAGWVARDAGPAGPAAVRPAQHATSRGVPIPWVAPGLAADSIAIRLVAEDGAVALDTVVGPTAGDTAYTAAPEPGTYGYRAEAFAGDTVSVAEGPLTVERYTPEFARTQADLRAFRTEPVAVRTGTDRGAAMPLRASPLPWLLLVVLLGTEWILRRRWGLR
jgi:hypothetical protein